MSSFDFVDGSSQYNVYTGFWTNWSRGPIFGATWTVPRQGGTVLIAVLALFVSIVGSHFWTIVCFCLHYAFSSSKKQDGLYHQRQAILRNSPTGTSGLWGLSLILTAWKRSGNAARPYGRILPLICVALCHVVAFAVAGAFSSKVATAAGNEVLVSSPNCGILEAEKDPDVSELTAYLDAYEARLMASYATFTQQCYRKTSDTGDCRAFVKRNLPTAIDRNVTCPFDDGMCLSASNNIQFDTGYLDSNDDLGLNAPPEERVQIRRVSVCAPITTEGHRSLGKLYDTNTSYVQYEYGQAANFFDGNNYTYRYPEIKMEWELPTANTDYTFGGMDAIVLNGTMNNTNSDFVPIPALQKTDADLHLIFLSANSIIFAQPVDDLWYSAHRNVSQVYTAELGDDLEGTMDAIVQDDAASVLACTVKEQYCNPNLPEEKRCAPFGGEYESTDLGADLWTNKKQLETFNWVDTIIKNYRPSMHNVLYMLGTAALLSRQSLSQGFQGALPDDQWQLEAENWHATSMAALQGVMKEVAVGPSDPNVEKWLARPNTTLEHHLCRSQKIVNKEYFNFSVMGLALTLILGGFIIFVSYVIGSLFTCMQRRRPIPGDEYAGLEWNANGTLQLQRMAHEERGWGTWDRCAADVPVTGKGEYLAVLDVEDSKHPRLMANGPNPHDSGLIDQLHLNPKPELRVQTDGVYNI